MSLGISTTSYVFFHDVKHADHLLGEENGQPSNVVAVKFGWTREIEDARNAVMEEMEEVVNGFGFGVSALPSLHYWSPGWVIPAGTHELQEVDLTVPPHWEELRVLDIEEEWTWDNILAARQQHENDLQIDQHLGEEE